MKPAPWRFDGETVKDSSGAAVVSYLAGHPDTGCLIASAPDLLEALKAVRAAVHKHWNDASLVDSKPLDQADAAIAKAEGKP